jgi:hypothetical protein
MKRPSSHLWLFVALLSWWGVALPAQNASPAVLASATNHPELSGENLPDVLLTEEAQIATNPWLLIRNIFEPELPEWQEPKLGTKPRTGPDEKVAFATASGVIEIPLGSGPVELPPGINGNPLYSEPNQVSQPRLPRVTGVILAGNDDRTALIDGSIVREGDSIQGFKLFRIRKHSVVLKRNKEEHVIYVQP